MDQLDVWQSEFGDAYTDRNETDWRIRLEAFNHMFEGLTINRVLEVGCNRGHNLRALSEILDAKTEIVGVEPNRYALELARQASSKSGALFGQASDLPFKDGYFDMVFTAGVLIHIPPADLPKVLAEIHRASGRYILAIEYFADEDTPINYRGQDDLLWKRNFLEHYKNQFSDLDVIKEGFWDSAAGFDNCRWWLMEKVDGIK